MIMRCDLAYDSDKNHGVPQVSTGSLTRSKAKKIQQAFVLHLQDHLNL